MIKQKYTTVYALYDEDNSLYAYSNSKRLMNGFFKSVHKFDLFNLENDNNIYHLDNYNSCGLKKSGLDFLNDIIIRADILHCKITRILISDYIKFCKENSEYMITDAQLQAFNSTHGLRFKHTDEVMTIRNSDFVNNISIFKRQLIL